MSYGTKREYDEFRAYCRTLTDEQCVAVAHKERAGAFRDSTRDPHFQAAADECHSRGLDWTEE